VATGGHKEILPAWPDCRPVRPDHAAARAGSAFVAVWALLGVKVFSGNNEHIVALDADAVQHALGRARRIAGPLWIGCMLGFGHGQILPH
jgi:hypothetical protein